MWFNVIKVDEFTTEGKFKGLYSPKEDKVSINLDKFTTVAEKYNDVERIVEFANVVTHELSHREYSRELSNYMDDAIKELTSACEQYSDGNASLDLVRKKLKIFYNYIIINESFAYGSAKSYEKITHMENTKGSLRSVMTTINKHIRKIRGIKDKKLEIMLGELYTETMKAISNLNKE